MKKRFLMFLMAASALFGLKAQDNIIDRVEWVVGDKRKALDCQWTEIRW